MCDMMIMLMIMIMIMVNVMILIISLLLLLVTPIRLFPALDELGMYRASLVSPEQPGWHDCNRILDMTVVLAVCLGCPCHALVSFLVSDSYISGMKSPRPRVFFVFGKEWTSDL